MSGNPILTLSMAWADSCRIKRMNKATTTLFTRHLRSSLRVNTSCLIPAAAAQGAILRPLRVRHSRMLLSLDFPRDGEVLEPSGIQAKTRTGPPIKTFGGDEFGSHHTVLSTPRSLLQGVWNRKPVLSEAK